MSNNLLKQQFKQTEIGEIPHEWAVKRLGDIADTATGGTPSRAKKDYFSGNVPWVKSGELEDGVIIDTEEKISEDAVYNSSAKKFPKGTLLIALYGATVGKTALLGIEAATNQAVCAIFPKENIISSGYLQYFMMQNRPTLIRARYGGAQPNISQQIIQDFLVAIPPKPEQEKTAGVLSKIQKAVENQEKIVADLRELKSATIAKLFRDGIHGEPLKETEIGEIPRSWEVVPIGKKYIFTGKPRDKRFADHKNIPFLPMDMMPFDGSNISKYVMKPVEKISSGIYFEEGDLLVSKITPCFENGKQGIALSVPNGFGVATTEVIPIKAIPNISDIKFLSFYLLEPNIRKMLAGKMQGATGRQRLDKTLLESWKMPFPPLPEQQEIVKVLENIMSNEQIAEKRKVLMQILFSSTLNHLMTGKVRIGE